jgi:glycosyltransferase involved in cell wall biosynthesis
MEPKVIMVGVLPPPIHGQSLATQALFDADLSPIRKITIPIRSSKTLKSVGKLSFGKAFSLIPLVAKAWSAWLRHRPSILYYTAGSGAWVPFTRDVVFLSLCRPLFKRTLIHYHSGNLQEFVEKTKFRTLLGRFAYGRGAWTLRLGPGCPAPNYPENRVFDLPNGLDAPPSTASSSSSEEFRILFLGNLFKEKGVLDLIDAVGKMALSYPSNIRLSLIGNWPSDDSKAEIDAKIAALPPNVHCPAPRPAYGQEKWQLMAAHNVFAFPSYYRSENLPLVVIEAMAASLPVVATDWRGINSLIENDKNGLLIPIRDLDALATALAKLAADPELSKSMGNAGRQKYEASFTSECHMDTMRRIFLEAHRAP